LLASVKPDTVNTPALGSGGAPSALIWNRCWSLSSSSSGFIGNFSAIAALL
jgi:hypothetical protein